MAHGYRVLLDVVLGATVASAALRVGSDAANRALSTFDAAFMARLQPLASRNRNDLDGTDYLDASVLEYALYKALEAAFPLTGGEPSPPLSRDCFVLRITKETVGAKTDASPA